MAVISLMGIDGCGKSTLSRALAEELRQRGEPAIATWAMLRPFLLRPLIAAAKFLLVRKAPKSEDYHAHIAAKRAGMDRLKFAHAIYLAVMVIDYLPQAWWKVGLPRLLGRHVICDRYYHDMALDYAITVNGDSARMMRVLRLLQRLVPRTDLHYYVDVPPEVAFARKDDVPSVAYLVERAGFYRAMASELALPGLDGRAAPAENGRRIIEDMKRVGALGT